MKITDFKLYYVPLRFLYLKIETDEGISGCGEPLVEGRAATLEGAVNEWRDYFIGKDPLLIEDHWQTMYRGAFYRGGPVLMSAMAGIDQALWDIKGKFYNMPVYEMLGGVVKNRIKVYRGIRGETKEELVEDTKRAVSQGYNFVKTSPNQPTHYIDSIELVDDLIDKVAAIREAAGNTVDVAIDFHGRIHKSMAKVMVKELDQFRMAFFEEPVLPTNKEALREIARYTSSPIALGERVYNRWEFKEILIDGYADIIQPDLSHAGGISECRRIGAMAEAFDVAYAPHCPLSVIAFAACVQTVITTPNAVFQEQSIDIHDCRVQNEKLKWIKNPEVFGFDKGYITLPKGPGLGIEVNEEAVIEANRDKHNWKNPLWRTYDGTPIEW